MRFVNVFRYEHVLIWCHTDPFPDSVSMICSECVWCVFGPIISIDISAYISLYGTGWFQLHEYICVGPLQSIP